MFGAVKRAIPRYANLGWAGFRGNEPQVPYGGRADMFAQQAGTFVRERPIVSGVGAMAANHLFGNPVGGFVDALTFGATDFRPEDVPVGSQQIILQQPIAASNAPPPNVSYSVPQLDADQIKRQQDYLKRKVATDVLTLEALRNAQLGMGASY